MKIELLDVFCPQLNRTVKIALDSEGEDPYRNSFKEAFHVPVELRFMLDSTHGISSFVDVGANIGHFTISAGLMGIPTVAIEAMADNYLLLTKALSANAISNVLPFHIAASEEFSLVALHSYGAWAMVSSVGKGDTPAMPLDELLTLIGKDHPDLIKIDVEGHEIPVLNGLKQTLNTARPMLIFEGNSWTARDAGGSERLLQMVESFGYDLFVFNRDGTCRPITSKSFQDVVCVDYFAYPKDVTEHRSRPQIRVPTIDERLSIIEAEVEGGEPHRWHISAIIDRFAAEADASNAQSSRIDVIRQRLEQQSFTGAT